MHFHINRRQFVAQTTAASLFALLGGFPSPAAEFKGKIRKAMIVGKVTEEALEPLKAAGFEGVETTQIGSEEEAAKGRDVADKLGLKVHSVLRGWIVSCS